MSQPGTSVTESEILSDSHGSQKYFHWFSQIYIFIATSVILQQKNVKKSKRSYEMDSLFGNIIVVCFTPVKTMVMMKTLCFLQRVKLPEDCYSEWGSVP